MGNSFAPVLLRKALLGAVIGSGWALIGRQKWMPVGLYYGITLAALLMIIIWLLLSQRELKRMRQENLKLVAELQRKLSKDRY